MPDYHPVKAVVFDFDGTLVDSNKVKRDSFFKLFPDKGEYAEVLMAVLDEMGESSRVKILGEVLKRKGLAGAELEFRTRELVDVYAAMVNKEVRSCPEMPLATELLEKLSKRYELYICSMTPHEQLTAFVEGRRWMQYVASVYGYPHGKPNSLRKIMTRERISPSELLVVGDGESDRHAAKETECHFYPIQDSCSLQNLLSVLNRV